MGEERKLACTRTVAVPFKIDDQRPTGGTGGLGGNGSGGGMGLGGVGLGGVGIGVGAGPGFCGTFIASKYSTANIQNSTPDVELDIDPRPWPKVEAASLPLNFSKRLEAASTYCSHLP